MKNENRNEGFILPMVLMLLVVITLFGLTLIMMSQGTFSQSEVARMDQVNINKAHERYQRALTAIQDNLSALVNSGAELLDTNGNNFIDSGDTVASQDVALQNNADGKMILRGEFRSCANPEILRDHFIVKTSGVMGNSRKNILADVEYKSFLYYARFCDDNVPYGPGAVISGEFYSGGTVTVSGPTVKFLKDVTLRGDISGSGFGSVVTPNHKWANAEINGTLTQNYTKDLSLDIGSQVTSFFNEAATCGWKIDTTHGRNCLGNSAINEGGASADNLFDFSNLKDLDTNAPYYESADCRGANKYYLPSNFNGVIAWADSNTYSIHVQGVLGADGHGKSVSIFSHGTIYIDTDVLTNRDSNNHPVNIGLIADGSGAQVAISARAPIFLTVKAALMSAQSNWASIGPASTSGLNDANTSHPPKFGTNLTTAVAYDMDGNTTLDNPNKWGYNENALIPGKTVMLNIIGPIITMSGGSSGLYACGSSTNCGFGTSYTTRDYGYDVDILAFPPPFPRIKNLLHLVSYTETEDAL